jgi:hypothetical protein
MQSKNIVVGTLKGPPKWAYVASGIVLMIVIGSCTGPKKKSEFDESDAHVLCDQAIKLASKDPQNPVIPYVAPRLLHEGEFQFEWGHSTKMLRLRNGFGLEVAASGSCGVSREEKRVIRLTLEELTLL